ncbi:M14 family zinc carboxypeptidase [Prolixibacteraceae bacterium Z1-6]|uniref:M14 family zinc carboxypeptidase n=1 Tax=Draconibacterium aestuarii TaxID=2998507 RepID=A0A9X3J6J3_9BACT|nr:M14 family zinc carboxypeptidase [Prolixibacteraceae bacterium Z1-6]
MKLKFSLTIVLIGLCILSFAQNTFINLKYEQNYTPTYYEIIEMFQLLDSHYENAILVENGLTDSGKPLHTFIINNEKEFNPEKIKAQGKTVLLINNGIHAGEPCGIDASLEFADNILRNKDGLAEILDNTVIIIIPAYSVGGLLNRSAYNRSGQTTPYETGFRGNAGNYDLNRDFLKCDSENAKNFNVLFTKWDPDVFLDTHTTNGSEHQYSVTLIAPQPDMFSLTQEQFIREKLLPGLFSNMKKGDYELIPYVSWMYPDPKRGIKMTQETGRYSSGYASLFNSYGMMTENHVYKDYPDRVKSCYQFIEMLARFTAEHSTEIIESREKGIQESMTAKNYSINFELDTTQFRMIEFKGYEVDEKQISPVSGLPRFGYNKTKPYTEEIKFFDVYSPTEEIIIPEYYILPQAWKSVVDQLIRNGIEFSTLQNDTTIEVEIDYIEEYSNAKIPYNGHYFHDKVLTRSEIQRINYNAGDLVIPVRQKKIRYLIETLEPKARDSFFRWNFFDNILDAREYFSSYGFEENALKYLDEHPEFKKEFEAKQKSDPEFAKNHRAQLAYIYNNTEWAEKSFERYPVGRIY